MRVAGSNAVLHLNYLPLLSAFDDGALVEPSFFPIKALFLPRSPKALELGAAGNLEALRLAHTALMGMGSNSVAEGIMGPNRQLQ